MHWDLTKKIPILLVDILKERDEALQAELEACDRRKQELKAVAEFHLTPEPTEMEKENNLR